MLAECAHETSSEYANLNSHDYVRVTDPPRSSTMSTSMRFCSSVSRKTLCICVAIDVHKNPVAVVCGHGKPSSARVRKAMGGRIAPGSLLIHSLERAHGALVREGGLESEAHRADVNDPVYLERMVMVNDLCSWLKRYLGGTYRSLRRLT